MIGAVGVHDHPTKKLGLRPASRLPRIELADHLKAIPEHPIADPPPGLTWPMDRNDQWGDCVVAGSDHALQAINVQLTGSYTNWTDDKILAYYRTQNPDFNPQTGANDDGMDVQKFLGHLVRDKTLLGFAAVDMTDDEERKAAIYLGLALIIAVDLTKAQQGQGAEWDWVPHSADWGGHCVTEIGYLGDPDEDMVVSWGQVCHMHPAFIDHQVVEAWFPVTAAHVANPGFRAGFDLPSFGAAFTSITGRAFPA